MSSQTVQKQINQYVVIFVTLLVLTLFSVSIHYLNLPRGLSIVLILAVSIAQATLSACYLMHLISERKLIYFVLSLTAVFFLGLILLTYFGYFSVFEGQTYVY